MKRAVVVLVIATACGPSRDEEDEPRKTCGGEDPVQLVALPELGATEYSGLYGPTIIGDRIVATWLELAGVEVADSYAFAVSECGEDYVELESAGGIVGGAGEWAFAQVDGEEGLRAVALEGNAPSEIVFESAVGSLIPMQGGVVTFDAQGTVWFHAAPDDPNAAPVEIIRGAIVPESFYGDGGDFTYGYPSYGDVPVRDGEGLLVALRDGPLVHVTVPGGEREVLVEGPVGQFVVLDDPRYVLWRGGDDGDDCCTLLVHDRATGVNRVVAGGQIPLDIGWDGDWVDSSDGFPGENAHTTFTNVESGYSWRLDDWFSFEASLDDGRLLVRRIGGDDGTFVFDTPSQTLEPIDFPEPPWKDPKYPDGVVALDLPEDAHTGTLLLLAFDGVTIETLAEDVPDHFSRTQSGDVVYLDRPDDADTGTLVHVTRDGTKRTLSTDVSAFTIPFHGTANEREEVLFTVHGPERGGLWRYVLP